jgi:hypothetical protein
MKRVVVELCVSVDVVVVVNNDDNVADDDDNIADVDDEADDEVDDEDVNDIEVVDAVFDVVVGTMGPGVRVGVVGTLLDD